MLVAAVTAALGRQPAALMRSLTWDQGREMARWADVEAALGIEVFFCEPRSPWQRPTNEHTNALLRRWLPKGTSLDIGQLRLSVIEDNLDHMPRRLHHWASAHDIYTQLTCIHRWSSPTVGRGDPIEELRLHHGSAYSMAHLTRRWHELHICSAQLTTNSQVYYELSLNIARISPRSVSCS